MIIKVSVEYETFCIFSIKNKVIHVKRKSQRFLWNGNPSERNMKGVFSLFFFFCAYPAFINLELLVSSDRCGRESLELTDSQVRNGKHVHSLNVNKTSMYKMGIDQNSSWLLFWIYWSPCKRAGLEQTHFYFYFVSFLTVFFHGAQK